MEGRGVVFRWTYYSGFMMMTLVLFKKCGSAGSARVGGEDGFFERDEIVDPPGAARGSKINCSKRMR